jgi:hypothetical protein
MAKKDSPKKVEESTSLMISHYEKLISSVSNLKIGPNADPETVKEFIAAFKRYRKE